MTMVNQNHNIGDIVLSTADIEARVAEMAQEIDAVLAACRQVQVVGVLKGAAFFNADLVRHMKTPALMSYTTVSSYGWNALNTDGPKVVHDTDLPDLWVLTQHLLEIVSTSAYMTYWIRDVLTAYHESFCCSWRLAGFFRF